MDFHVPSPIKDFRRQFSSPHKIKTDSLISPLKLSGASKSGKSSSESKNNNTGAGAGENKGRREKETELVAGFNRKVSRQPDEEEILLKDEDQVNRADAEVQEAQSLGCEYIETDLDEVRNDLIDEQHDDEGLEETHDALKNDGPDAVKRKAGEALSSEEESRKKRDVRDTKVNQDC